MSRSKNSEVDFPLQIKEKEMYETILHFDKQLFPFFTFVSLIKLPFDDIMAVVNSCQNLFFLENADLISIYYEV